MFSNIRFLTILTVLNLAATAGIGWWVYTKEGSNAIDVEELEDLLEELSQSNPHFLVSLLNESANESAEDDEEELESNILSKRADISKAGFVLKEQKSASQKELIIFGDMINSDSLTYLKNVYSVLANLNCSVRLIPISMFGAKATEQAKLITAAALQSIEKAVQLALAYTPVEGAQNNMIAVAEKLGLSTTRLSQEIQAKAIDEIIIRQTKMSEELAIPGVPCIFLLTADKAYILPPMEAKDLPALIENPQTKNITETPSS